MGNLISNPGLSQLNMATLWQSMASFISLVYLSIALGCGFVALALEFAGRVKCDREMKSEMAAKCARIASRNFGIGFIFGVLPLFVLYATYSVFLYGIDTYVVQCFLIAAALNFVGLSLLNQIRITLNVKQLVQGTDSVSQDFVKKANASIMPVGALSIAFLLAGGFMLASGNVMAADPSQWADGFVAIFASIQIWLKFLAFVFGSLAIAGVAIIFSFLSCKNEKQPISEKAKHSAIIHGATISIVSIPLFAFFTGMHLKFIPRSDFSLQVIGMSACAVILLFFALHMVYHAFTQKHTKAGVAGFVLVILSFLFVVLADNSTRENALRKHTFALVKKNGTGTTNAANKQ